MSAMRIPNQATLKQWRQVEEWAEDGECSWDACILELRTRVEELELSLASIRLEYLKLANACAAFAPDRNKFYSGLMSDGDDGSEIPLP